MRKHLVTLAAAIALFALPSHGKDRSPQYDIDESVTVNAASGYDTRIQATAGPVTFTEVKIRNIPSAEEIRRVTRATENSRPKPVVFARNDGQIPAKVHVRTILEDDMGTALMTCDRTGSLDPGERNDWNMCLTEAMHTLDWPQVRVVHLIAQVDTKE